MRLFIGIELSDALRSSAAAATNRVRERIASAAPAAQIRWLPPANLHVTIWFLGEVREPRAEALAASLKQPLSARPFTLRVGGAGAFPPSGAPRAIWLGLAAGRDDLVAIYDELGVRLSPLGFAPEKRPYSPHVTIARVKDVRPADAAALRRLLRDTGEDVGQCGIASVTLFASRPTPTGSTYEAIRRVILAG
jgi:RNA 2',3'-cyclic 3'-phosphodiesterase